MKNPQPQSLEKLQESTLRDPGVKGKLWVSKVEIPSPPEDETRQALFRAVDDLKDDSQAYIRPSCVPVGAEWTGYRASADKDSTLPSISEEEKYKSLMSETKSTTTILYFHGGAYYLMDLAAHRPLNSRLAKLTGGRTLSVRYRLAPQSAFPSQLLDALCAYLYLLHPPPGSFHSPVRSSDIVLAGDSAGGNLAFGLLQLLMQLHRTSPTNPPKILYHGTEIEVPLPAGIACNSPWLDITRSPPSLESNAHTDYLPPPSKSSNVQFPTDRIWPTDPPRGDIFCDASMMDHPLASPLAFGEADWKGAPPIFICCGQELLTDEDAIVAGRAARAGVKVRWEQFEAMPHCFAMILEGLDASRRCLELWGESIKEMVEKGKEGLETRGTWWAAKTMKESALDVKGLGSGWTEEEVRGWMKAAKEKRREGWEKEGKDLPKL
ncbi:hypothetical protein EV356DRAFT_497795 [Viridothelium virens]|uniref:Alpha/beta hydrolase fold-3 domain-containing protein n=1 Tax=Viridothelium virens TaxID=1048519 RepID=A0A6A6HFG3_VIRVR|nr:hypothetical protein EV356DRAFT_497795 [Viridothelium virens]